MLRRGEVESFDEYPFNIPAVNSLRTLELNPRVTFFIGENGSGKSTLVEAIAVAAGFNAEGGTKNFSFSTRKSHSKLSDCLQVVRGAHREKDGFFLRAESLFNVASQIEELDRGGCSRRIIDSYGGRSLHEQSHGESFLALISNRFGAHGLYILDEPEAALSPTRQVALLAVIDRLVNQLRSQFIIATHSPIIMAYPEATIYRLGSGGIEEVAFEETEHYILTRSFLADHKTFLSRLFRETATEKGD